MDETELQENIANNILFSLLGGICAIIVGIAIYGASTMTASPTRAPSSESTMSEFLDVLPILE